MDGMAVYNRETGELMGHTTQDAATVRKFYRNVTGVYGQNGSLTARGTTAMTVDTVVIGEAVFARFGRVQTKITGHTWRDDPATVPQIEYLAQLGISTYGRNLTKGEASQLIDSIKNGDGAGSFGFAFVDGSN